VASTTDTIVRPEVKSTSSFAADVAAGLAAHPKRLPSQYFYDHRGSQLFQRITQLDEYYLTRCELEILENGVPDALRRWHVGRLRVIELGAGDGPKTEMLLDRLLGGGYTLSYTPIDICAKAVHELTQRIRSRFADARLVVEPIVGEYAAALERVTADSRERRLCLFLGSSIGNFAPREAVAFLRRACGLLQPSDLLLIGFDLIKHPRILRRAYDDSNGVTREFNYNLLDRINRELGADFKRRKFVHHCEYNAAQRRMESWLVSTENQVVTLPALRRSFRFEAWEGMLVEWSYKYGVHDVERYAAAAGCKVVRHLFDSRRYFVDSLWARR